MGELNQDIFLQWLEVVFSQSWNKKLSIENNKIEKCFSINILSKSFINLRITINIELVKILSNFSHPVRALCSSSSSSSSKKWYFKLLEPKRDIGETLIGKYSTPISTKPVAEIGFSKAKIVLISFCGTLLALFFVVVVFMRIRNCVRRRTKLYKDSLPTRPHVVYEDFDLNPRSEDRIRYYHNDIQWIRHPRDIVPTTKTGNFYNLNCKEHCNCQICKKTEIVKITSSHQNYSLRPLLNTCHLIELRKHNLFHPFKETILGSSFSRVQSATTKRRHSLVDQIESVMNKHFDKNGVSKTWSNENLKRKSLFLNQIF